MVDLCSSCLEKEVQETESFRNRSWKLQVNEFPEGNGIVVKRRVVSTEDNVLCYNDLLHEALGIAKYTGMEYNNDGVNMEQGICDYWEGHGMEMFIQREPKDN
jgi:hypothetical protein